MKKAFLGGLFLLLSSSLTQAEVSVGGAHFVACGNCFSDLQFKKFASDYSLIAPEHTVLVVVNNHLFSDLEGPIIEGQIRQMRRAEGNVNLDQYSPQELALTFDYGASEDLVNYEFEPVSQSFQSKYADMIEGLKNASGSYTTTLSKNIGVVEVGMAETLTWLNSGNFADENRAILNDISNELVSSPTFNPFYFVNKPLTIRITTNDYYSVTLTRKLFSVNEWQVLYATTASGTLVDNAGEAIEVQPGFNESFVCAPLGVSVFCRERGDGVEYTETLYQTFPAFELDKGGIHKGGRPGLCRTTNCTSIINRFLPDTDTDTDADTEGDAEPSPTPAPTLPSNPGQLPSNPGLPTSFPSINTTIGPWGP